MIRASWGSPCEMDRAFVDPTTGKTTCVWKAPASGDLEELFTTACVEVLSITPVDEVSSGDVSPS